MKRTVKTLLLASAALFCLPFAACKEETREPFFESTPELPPVSDSVTELPPTVEPTPELPPAVLPPEETEGPQQKSEALYVRMLTDGLNVRKGAGTRFECLGQAEKGTLLQCVGRQDGWYETRYLGKTAYVSANERYTAVATLPRADEEAVERIVEEGLKLLGTPYVYGAVRLHDGKGGMLKNFTASAFDCSSLMQYIFYEGAGILLDVNTRTQIKQGETVTWEHIRRGDLLFFTNAARKDKTGIERVGHVGLYLGEGYLLHTASDFAKVEQLSPLRKSYFLTARRMV